MHRTIPLSLLLGALLLVSILGWSPPNHRQLETKPNKRKEPPTTSPPVGTQSSSRAQAATATRRTTLGVGLVSVASFWLLPNNVPSSHAFEGGIGGLGKTKPETGIVYWNAESVPLQNSLGWVTAELNVNNKPVLCSFQSPWPLLATGVEARNVQTSDSAFLQVVQSSIAPTSKTTMTDFLLASILSQTGKFGAYGSPFDIKVKQLNVADDDNNKNNKAVTCMITFTTFTPGLRESERQVLIKAIPVFAKTYVVLVAGSTRQSFNRDVFQSVVDSFDAVPAPTR